MKYGWLIRYSLPHWRKFAMILGLTAVSSVVAVLQPWPLKILVDYGLSGSGIPPFIGAVLRSFSAHPTTALFVAAALASLALFVLNSVLDVGLSWAWSAAGEHMTADLAVDMFHRLQRMSLLFHGRRPTGESLTCLSSDSYCAYQFMGTLMSPVQCGWTLLAVGGVAWSLDRNLTSVMFLVAPLHAASAFYFGRRLKHRAQQDRSAQSRLRSFVHQTLTAIPIVQVFGTEERNAQQFRILAADAVERSQRGALVGSAYSIVNGLTTTLATAAVLYIGARNVMSGATSVGTLLAFIAYLRSTQTAFLSLLTSYATFKSTEVSIERVKEILGADGPVRNRSIVPRLAEWPRGGRGRVRFENVTFGYETGRPVLQDVSLEANPGETIALVGATGAGKSTLASLIPRFFEPWTGRVTVDGIDVREIEIERLRTNVAIVLQEPFLFPVSIAENIAFGRPGANRDEIIAAAVAANADDFIRRLSQGYDTSIGERGATLSGGEKQRIAIARAFLKDAPILILDEPTSALDARTESALLNAMERLMDGRTTFIIAHRLSSVRNADRIVVLDHGRIVETGSPLELLEAKGYYQQLHRLQFSDLLAHVAQ